MLFAVIFYGLFFLASIAVPAGQILVVLLFLDKERRLWKRLRLAVERTGAGRLFEGWVRYVGLPHRVPRTTQFVARRFDPLDPWGLPATVAGLFVLLGLWFFLGVLEDVLANDPLAILNVRLHNAVPLFRTTATTWLMLVITQLGSTAVLALLCVGSALLSLASRRPRLAATFMLALIGTGVLSATLKTLILKISVGGVQSCEE